MCFINWFCISEIAQSKRRAHCPGTGL
uniref:Uncharacterized protein n=1 Tax=Anguilla anguilla TaxID=7936 RepID=A0A0E9Q5G0_ANGAN